MKPGEPMSYEEWLEMRIQFEKEVRHVGTLNSFAFWKYPSVGKCSERQRAYLAKTAEMRAADAFGVWE